MAAKPLVLRVGGRDIAVQLEKVDRSRLYGWVDTEALDETGRPCELATLAQDGRTLVGEGGRGLAMLSPDGRWVDRKELRPIDMNGDPLEPQPSSFAAPVDLVEPASVDDYLEHNVRACYLLDPVDDASPLVAALEGGKILRFPFSFRGGLAPDVGFVLQGADGGLFLAIGQPSELHYAGLENESAAVEEEELEPGEGEELDFGML
jgi:hypothetical protein